MVIITLYIDYINIITFVSELWKHKKYMGMKCDASLSREYND